LDAAIAAALRDLAPRLRAAIVLTAMQGLNVRTAAKVEGCSIGTMYWRIYEARKFLHRRLEQFYFLYHEYAT
jgi:DNA-directed RNA polymerase specialized sigma24 family protein